MRKMRFDREMEPVTLYPLIEGMDVMVLTGGKQEPVTDENGTETISYVYDGNIFRTFRELTFDDIKADIEGFLTYEGDELPTEKMKDYADKMVDEFTLQLMEEGLL